VAEVAKALNLPFHSMSVSNQTTKTDLMGFVDANGVYRYNGFITAFRDGGVFNMDEIDAGNANVLVVLNSALSNGFVETPSGEMIYKHKDFRFCATANTVGRGATAKYVGRNKLDSATLDRFAVINFDLDEDIELMLCGGDKNYHDAIKEIRKLALRNYEDVQISQRSATRLYHILKDSDFTVREALDIAVFKGVDEDICKALDRKFKEYFKAEHKKALEGKVVEPKVPEVVEPKVPEVEKVEVEPEVDEITEDDVEEFRW
jgi:cobaltochelatase CobS